MARVEKLSVSLPSDLVKEMKELVSPGEISSFIAEAARHHLARWRFRRALERGLGAWSDANHPDLTTPEDSSRFVRCLREADIARRARLEE